MDRTLGRKQPARARDCRSRHARNGLGAGCPRRKPKWKSPLGDGQASIVCGKLRAAVSASGKIRFFNQRGELLLEEFVRDMSQPEFSSHMRIAARELKGHIGGLYAATQRFESDPRKSSLAWANTSRGFST